MTPEELFADHPRALALVVRAAELLRDTGAVEVRTTRSQVAFRRRRGFAYVWRPGQYPSHPATDAVLSIALGRHVASPRWKEVIHPAPKIWMHHLEVRDVADLDDEVAAWLREAADLADDGR